MRALVCAVSVLVLCFCFLVPDAVAESIATPYVDISNVTVKEGNSGKSPFTAQVRLMWYSSMTVNVYAVPDTAGSSDFEFTPVQVTISAGASQTVTGYVIGDLAPEGDERFRLMATATGDGGYYSYIGTSAGIVTIIDDDQAAGLHMEGTTLPEGEGKQSVEARVRLEPASAVPVTVDYATAGTEPSVDYVTARGRLSFQPGEVLKTIPLTFVGNTTWELDKKITVTLSNPQSAQLLTSSADIVLVNDDPPTRATLDDMAIDEGHDATRTVPVTIIFDRPTPATAKLSAWTENGTALDGTDFRGGAQTLYPQGATQVTYNLQVLGDTQPECDKAFYIHYRTAYMGDDREQVAKVLLRNDDDGLVNGCLDPFSVSPADGGTPDLRPDVRDEGRPDTISSPDGGAIVDRVIAEDASNGPITAPESSDRPDGAASTARLSRGSGACTFAPVPRRGLLSLAVLGLALAWVRARRRN